MKIDPLKQNQINKIIDNLDKKLPDNNPSIFMPFKETDGIKIDDEFLFKQLYT